jgi:hypothetical protein
MFSNALDVTRGATVERDGFVYCDFETSFQLPATSFQPPASSLSLQQISGRPQPTKD